MNSKPLSVLILWPLLFAGLLVCPSRATAQTAYWDPGHLNASPGSGGTGAWDTASTNWWVSGTGDGVWPSGSIADFAGSAGTVTLGVNATANGLTFGTAGYYVGGTATLTLGGATPTITIPAGITTLNPKLAGTAGLTLNGPGTLALGATSTYTGTTTVGSGASLRMTNIYAVGKSTIALGANSALTLAQSVVNGTMTNVVSGDSTTTFNVTPLTGANTYYSGSLANFYGTLVCSNVPGSAQIVGFSGAGPFSMPATAAGVYIASNTTLYLPNAAYTLAAPVVVTGGGSSYGALRVDAPCSVSGPVLLNAPGTNNSIGTVGAGTSTISGVISDGGRGYGLLRGGGGSTAVGSILALSGQNTYSGPTTLVWGKLQVAAAENPGVSGPLGKNNVIYFYPASGSTKYDCASLMYSSANQYDYSSRFSTDPGQQYKIDLYGQNVSFATPLTSAAGAFFLFDTTNGTTKGTLTFNAANTYYGGTTISNATLVANVAGAIPATGPVVVGSGKLNAAVAGAVPGAVTVRGGVLSATVANSVQGNITLTGGSLTISNASALSQFATLTLPASPANNSVNLNFTGTQTISALYFGAVSQPTGTWGPIGSSAANQSAAFTGTGILNVVVPTFANAYWDPSGLNASPGSGGSGTWNSSLANWWESGSSDTTWPPMTIANFAGSAGTVTLAANETAMGLAFATSGYTVTNSAGSVLTLAGVPTVSVVDGGTATIGCPIAGNAGLTQTGAGTLVLTGTNTYVGVTTIGGTLAVRGAGQLGGGLYVPNIVDGGAFIYSSSAPQTLVGVISDSGSAGTLTQQGPGLLTLSGASTYSGGTIIESNSVRVTTPTGLGYGPVSISNNASLLVDFQAGGVQYPSCSAVIGGSNAVVNFSQASTYYLTNDWSQFTGTNNLLPFAGTASLVQINAGSPAFNIPAAATWNLGYGANLVIGGNNIMNATVILNGPAAAAAWGALRMDSTATQAGNVLLAGTNSCIGSYAATGATISGTIMNCGNGSNLALTARSGDPVDVIIFSGANTYSGTTTLSNGILQVASAEIPGVSGPLGTSTIYFPVGAGTVNPGTLQYSWANQFDYSSRFSTAAGQQYRIDVNGQNVTFASPLSSSGGTFNLVGSGGGTLTLSAASTYNGGTIVNSGTLDIGPSASIMGNVTVKGGGLELDNPSALPAACILTLPGSPAAGTVNLNFTGIQNINALYFGSALGFAGTWGAVGSGALHESAAFTGTGMLNVATGSYVYAYWDPNGAKASPGSGGNGTWDAGTADWWVSGSYDTAWSPGSIPIFAGTAGVVVLNDNETAGGLTFNTPGYVLTNSPGAVLTLNGGAAAAITIPAGITVVDCILAGAGTLTETGPGTLVLGAANTYSGGTTIGSGSALLLTNAAGAGTGPITLNGVLTVDTPSSGAFTFPNALIGGATNVVNFGQHANYNLTGDLSQFTGTINLLAVAGGNPQSAVSLPAGSAAYNIPASATWNISSGQTLNLLGNGVDYATVILDGPGNSYNFGALRLDSTANQAGNVLLAGTNNCIGSYGGRPTISGVIMDSGSGNSVAIVARANSPTDTIVFSGANTYSGTTTLSNGTLQVASAENPGVSGPLGTSTISFPGGLGTSNLGTLEYSWDNNYDYSGRFSTAAGQQYRIDVHGQSVTFASPLTSSGGTLTLIDSWGGGTLTLSAPNTCNGGTTVSGGTLDVSSSGSIAGNVAVNGGTLELDNASALSPWITLSAVSGAMVNLNFTGTQDIGALYLDGVVQALGTWGAIGSGAVNQSAVFTGSGILNVTMAHYPAAYWDPNANNASPGSGGSGSWDNATADWWVSGSSDTTWMPGGVANFAGAAGTVTLNANETANRLTFTTPGYTLTNSPGSVLTLGGSAPTITVPAGTTTIGCNLAGSAGLTESGPGTLVLGGANTYSGGTVVNPDSTLRIMSATGAGYGPVSISNNAALTWDIQAGSIFYITNQVIGGPNSVVNFGQASTYYLVGDWSQFTGTNYLLAQGAPGSSSCLVELNPGSGAYNLPATATWNVAAGQSLVLGNHAGNDVMNATVILNGPGNSYSMGALRLDGTETQAGNVLLAGTNNSIGSYAATGATVSGTIMNCGSGSNLALVARSGDPVWTIKFSGANTYSGTTTLSNGILQVASAEIPGVSGPLGRSTIYFPVGAGTGNPGTLQYSGANNYDYSGRFSTAAGQRYTIDLNSQQVTFASPLTSSGGTFTLVDSGGGGTLTLSAASTYSGGTTVNAGTLEVSSSGSIAGNVTVNGGRLQLDSASAMSSTAALLLGSSAAPGAVNLNFSGTKDLAGLFVGGFQQAPGVYGASASNPGGVFTGSGTVTIGSGIPVSVSSVSANTNRLTISWTSVAGGNYNVYTTTNLAPPITWTLVNPTSPIRATSTTTAYTLPGSITNQSQLFVRVQN